MARIQVMVLPHPHGYALVVDQVTEEEFEWFGNDLESIRRESGAKVVLLSSGTLDVV